MVVKRVSLQRAVELVAATSKNKNKNNKVMQLLACFDVENLLSDLDLHLSPMLPTESASFSFSYDLERLCTEVSQVGRVLDICCSTRAG